MFVHMVTEALNDCQPDSVRRESERQMAAEGHMHGRDERVAALSPRNHAAPRQRAEEDVAPEFLAHQINLLRRGQPLEGGRDIIDFENSRRSVGCTKHEIVQAHSAWIISQSPARRSRTEFKEPDAGISSAGSVRYSGRTLLNVNPRRPVHFKFRYKPNARG